MEQHIDYLIEHFGYFGLIIMLIVGIIGLPIPDEVLLTYVGYNVYHGKLSYIISLICAVLGSVVGISLSYYIGYKFGLPLLKKFGPKINITEEKVNSTQKLFNKIGSPLILIGYFIPGVRHLTAYVAALNKFSFRKFVVYAYLGAILWSYTFITLGRKLGERWDQVGLYVSKYSMYLFLLVIVIVIMVYLYWRKKQQLRNVGKF
ncbi:DedA family protein [Neobacillus niacini]|uniref:DedA family protein n=1 Tax=Neobacillus niacini TaxID=86668 RepID=UPI000A84D736|nr:DedA family protein [Neobacillus niacini]MEC1522866.1 DedA family protein [Neobacillus niacini]